MAGSKNVIEIHGNRKEIKMQICNMRVDLDEYIPIYAPDPCKFCGGTVKFDTVLFGEPIPKDIMKISRQEIDKSDLIIAVGTSATVRPASGLLWIAKSQGAKIIEVNIEKTKLTTISDYYIKSKAKSFFVNLEDELTLILINNSLNKASSIIPNDILDIPSFLSINMYGCSAIIRFSFDTNMQP